MYSYEKTIIQLVKDCADNGIKTATATANIGNLEPLYLYFKKSTATENGQLVLIPDSDKSPTGFELATGEGLRCNVPYSDYFSWVKARVSRLPILAFDI